jgi:hypothetical protein
VLSPHSSGWPDESPWPNIEVRCKRHARPLAVWTLDPIRCTIVPRHRRSHATVGGHDQLTVWIDRADGGNGRIRHLANSAPNQGYHGTHLLHCGSRRDGHDVSATADRRLQEYLNALTAGRSTIHLY